MRTPDRSSLPLRIEAVLGPTNTGKTHLAVERMLSHPTGMIGLPLRLLAREVYDSVAALAGAQAVALITGEEKRIPPDPRYFVCTVEAMPTDQRVDFLAIDEVQLAEHDERGHVFTDRILHARGAEETLFLGAAPIEGLLRRLVPSVAVQTRPRLSTLTCIGSRKLHQLPPRSAVIAFSAADVYEIAERLRRRHGGAAVVLGALSPRARNAQVALYEAGEVHHIVATDAIGMGLNLDVDHVAIASLRKFDGTKFRDLRASELAQIAGRAGRFRSNGSFGSMAPLGPLPPSLVEAVETHSFPPITELRFRESRLDFSSVNDLRATLGAAAPEPFLRVQRRADDQRAFDELLERPTLRPHAEREEGLRQLWEVCGVPDFAGRISAGHLQLLAQLFEHLQSGEGGIPEDWVAREIARIDDPEGDFETLMGRIAAIRTWTYISHHPGWVRDPEHWQARSREIEDRLSDALHLGLTQRFVDRRASVVLSRQTRGRECELRVDEAGSVEAAGILVGRLRGVEFEAVAGLDQLVRSLVERGLGPHAEQRIRDLIETPHDAFVVDSMGWIRWRQVPVGRLVRGESALRPSAEPLDTELHDRGMKARLRRRLQAVAADHVAELFAPLDRPCAAALGASGRAICYRLREGWGFVRRKDVRDLLKLLGDEERKVLPRLDIRLGSRTVYVRSLLRPASMRARATLWSLGLDQHEPDDLPGLGRPSLPRDALQPPALGRALGYVQTGPRWIRADIFERVASMLRKRRKSGAFEFPVELPSWLGCDLQEAHGVLNAIGYAAEPDGRFSYQGLPKKRRRVSR